MLTNPNPAGFAFGEKLPSGLVNSAFAQLPYAVDGNAGGAYAPTAKLTIAGSAGVDFGASCQVSLLSSTDYLRIGSRSVRRIQPLGGALQNASTRFEYYTGTECLRQTSITDGGRLVVPVSNLVDGSTMTSVSLYVDGNGGGTGHGALPAEMPSIALIKYRIDTGTQSSVGATTDSSGSLGVYEAIHQIPITGLTEAIDEGATPAQYLVVIVGEAGANSAANALILLGIICQFTVTKTTPGG